MVSPFEYGMYHFPIIRLFDSYSVHSMTKLIEATQPPEQSIEIDYSVSLVNQTGLVDKPE